MKDFIGDRIINIVVCIIVFTILFSVSSNSKTFTQDREEFIKEVEHNIELVGGSYAEALATEARWKTLRDSINYAINHPRIDKCHPNISLKLNPEKADKKDKIKTKEKSKKEDMPKFAPKTIPGMDDKYETIAIICEYEKIKEVFNETCRLQTETFEMLQELEKMIKRGKTDYKICYWTFDDGPYAKTDNFLRRLDKYHIQATFFTTSINGKYCLENRKKPTAPYYQKYLKYGHTIGNHTYTHGLGKGLYDSKKNFVKAVLKQEDYVFGLTEYITDIYRFPGGSFTAGKLKNPIIKALRKKGYVWVDWTAQTGDGGLIKSKKQAYHNFKVSMGEPIEVLLCHDYSKKTYEIMPKMIKYARRNNYIFAPLFHESMAVNR